MVPQIRVHLLRYTLDGEYLAEPLRIDAQIVMDDQHGLVLEIPLPHGADHPSESAIQISVEELEKLSATVEMYSNTETRQPNEFS